MILYKKNVVEIWLPDISRIDNSFMQIWKKKLLRFKIIII